MIIWRRLIATISLAAAILASGVAQAAQLQLNAPRLSEDQQAQIRAASTLFALDDIQNALPQDLVAAGLADYERLLSVLFENGFLSSQISIQADGREVAAISALSPPGRIGAMTISIEPGAQFRFGETRIAPLAFATELPETFATGSPASISALRAASDAAILRWRDQGHAKAGISGQEIVADHPKRLLDVDIDVNPGPRLRFGKLSVSGNQDVRTRRIVQITGLPEGKVFSPAELERAQARLRRTGTFKSAVLREQDQIGRDDTLGIDLQVVENLPRRFGFGGELSTQEGLTVSGYWLHRNLFGGAERLRVDGEISGIGGRTGGEDLSLALRFDRPATFNEDTDFYALAEIERRDEVSFLTRKFATEIGIRRYATSKREYTFGLRFETAETEDAFGPRSYSLLAVPVGVQFDYRDNRLDATAGYFADIQVAPFYGISGVPSGLRSTADLRAYFSPGDDKKLTFAARAQLGSVVGPSLAEAPSDYLFYSGGGGTVRGQGYQSLGVDIGGGNTVGGRGFLGLSGEVRVKTGENLSIVGFADAGYVGREAFPDGSSGNWQSGAGIGVRYATGIGPIRLDIAIPVSGPDDASGFEIYLGIGQAF